MIEKNWGAEPERAPELLEGETLVFCEHGRVLGNVCYRSHWFRIVRKPYGGPHFLVVKHGAGTERFRLGYEHRVDAVFEMMRSATSDQRYMLMHLLFTTASEHRRERIEKLEREYRQAFVEGRIKKRKLPGRQEYKVWVDSPMINAVRMGY